MRCMMVLNKVRGEKPETMNANEALRMKILLDEAVTQLGLIDYLQESQNSSHGPSAFSSSVSKDVLQLLSEQKSLQHQYEKDSVERKEIYGQEEKKISNNKTKQLVAKIKENDRALTRALDNSPDEVRNRQKVHNERAALSSLFEVLGNELLEECTYETLREACAERKKDLDALKEHRNRERELDLLLKVHTLKLTSFKATVDKQSAAEEMEIRKTSKELQTLKMESASKIQRQEKLIQSTQEVLQRELQYKTQLLEQELLQLKKQKDMYEKYIEMKSTVLHQELSTLQHMTNYTASFL